jgi:hypothetical protein
MKQSQAWKNLERKSADLLGGKRICRGSNFSESLPDVEHPYFGIECKYRQDAPLYYYEYINVLKDSERHTVIYHKDRAALKLSTLAKIWGGDVKPLLVYTSVENKRYSKFLEDSLKQASKYNKERIPLVIYKRKDFFDEIAYLNKDDFLVFYDMKLWEVKLQTRGQEEVTKNLDVSGMF